MAPMRRGLECGGSLETSGLSEACRWGSGPVGRRPGTAPSRPGRRRRRHRALEVAVSESGKKASVATIYSASSISDRIDDRYRD